LPKKYGTLDKFENEKFDKIYLWPHSQNSLSQIRKIFVTLGLSDLRFLRLKVFLKQILLEFDLTYNKYTETPTFYVQLVLKYRSKLRKF
jgi:hypothetical protein